MKKIRLEMDVPEETWRKCAVQAAEAPHGLSCGDV